ncbi:MAG TPA: glycine cleavage system aminomethyltransferase GcvT [Paludibacter sp.]|nr:glycine cleavage system aminomethyltransferase GcvT [Paludibacter sp.]HOS45071.1 glycine cleavage system aminomethyltransferase GcvT [Paludibacter sp.]HPM08924.1 glycine cleavage system aminomethyltransferase GcvT [Paludibacter sp.]
MNFTPFINIHKALGAKLHEYAGYEMPIEYSGITDEHLTVRNAVGVFDVSHMGEIWVKGPKALEFLQRMTTNDLSVLPIGKAQYTCLPNGKGGILDDILIYHYEVNKYLLVVNAANTEKDWKWLNDNNKEGVEMDNATPWTAQLAIQGPKATKTLQKLTDINLSDIQYYHFTVGDFAGCQEVIISNTGYTGAGGFELYFHPEYAETIWHAIFEAGEEYGIKPIGLGARDTLRLESGFCLYGNDIDETTSPIEAGLGWITKFVEGKDFIDRPLFEKQKKEGVLRKLIRFEMAERGIPRQGYNILSPEGKIIGRVTSGTIIPGTKTGIGMGYVATGYAVSGGEIGIEIRGKQIMAKVK